MSNLKYLSHYPGQVQQQIQDLIDNNRLGSYLQKKYPKAHKISSSKALYDYTLEIKNAFIRKSNPLSKVIYDDKIHAVKHALGLHTYVSRVQGGKLKAKQEIRIASAFKKVPEEFLKMIVVHELAHLKEKDHNKAFYKLCQHMEPNYHQLELDLRLYLTHIELIGSLY
jgi:predicted metal-dependent hydrolase